MKASICDSAEFVATIGAHFESMHGCPRPIIRRVIDYRITWSAIRAIYKGKRMTSVLGIVHFIETLNTGCDVRAYLGKTIRDLALGDDEGLAASCFEGCALHAVDPRCRWFLFFQIPHEMPDVFLPTLYFYFDAIGGVTDESTEL